MSDYSSKNEDDLDEPHFDGEAQFYFIVMGVLLILFLSKLL